MNELLGLSATELAARIRRGQVSPVEVAEIHIDRIERINPHINAVVEERFSQAREEAKKAEQAIQKARSPNELPPFHGVPCTIKEHIQVQGMRQTAGLYDRREQIAQEDSVLVQRMRQAGLIILGTTNVPEGLMWFDSYNKVYGRTTNAYSLKHVAGGSSGGEGSIIGAAGSPMGLGGDIGGSIRLPAFFNGVAGHKATGGRIPETGTWPGVSGALARYKVMGPLARSVEDLKRILPHLAGPDGKDLSVDGPEWGQAPEFNPREIKVFWFDANGLTPPSKEMESAIHRAITALKDEGFQVEYWRPKGLHKGFELWSHALSSAGGPKFSENLGDGQKIQLFQQWLRWPLRKSKHIFPSLALATLENFLPQQGSGREELTRLRYSLRESIESKLGSHGVLLCPPFPRTAPKPGLHSLINTLGFIYCGIFNPMELPSTAVPTGFGEKTKLPTGVQIVGRRNNDHLTLFVAGHIEQSLGGWTPRPLQGVEA